MTARDFNGDGAIGLEVTNAAMKFGDATIVSVLLGNGDGTFGAPVSYGVGSYPAIIVAVDFNGDGILDLVAHLWRSMLR